MNELLTYVKLIKMYAWEVPFSKDIAGRPGAETAMVSAVSRVIVNFFDSRKLTDNRRYQGPGPAPPPKKRKKENV